MADKVEELGLSDFAARQGIDYWGGFPQGDRSQYYKIVLTGCRAGKILSFYIFMPVSTPADSNILTGRRPADAELPLGFAMQPE